MAGQTLAALPDQRRAHLRVQSLVPLLQVSVYATQAGAVDGGRCADVACP